MLISQGRFKESLANFFLFQVDQAGSGGGFPFFLNLIVFLSFLRSKVVRAARAGSNWEYAKLHNSNLLRESQ